MKNSGLKEEKEFQQLIQSKQEIQRGIFEILSKKGAVDYSFKKEVEFINGITSDFVIVENENSSIISTIECKKPTIGVTEFVRGIGQLFQYEYFAENDIKPKKYSQFNYDGANYHSVLVIPSDFYKNTKLDISKFKYPDTIKLIEINLVNNNARELDKEELKKLSADTNKISISSYYFRDNRIFEYYLLLKYVHYWEVTHPKQNKLDRKQAEENLKKINTINNGNWRNAFITCATLGLLDSNNLLTVSGVRMCKLSLSQFTVEMYKSYMFQYIDLIMDVIFGESTKDIIINNDDISQKIRERFDGKDVLFLTESNNRYISSFLNIMRDDLGCIDFESRKKKRTFVYTPKEFRDSVLEKRISEKSIGNEYVDKFNDLIENKEFIDSEE